MGRAPCCEKAGLKKGRWTAEEDEILTKYIQANGEGSWRSLPKNAGLLRCGKSCRLRWINYLRTDLKRGNITQEEEETIVKLHTALGNRWSLIAAHLPGRTDNEIKNYWNSHLSRKIYRFNKIRNFSLQTTMNIAKILSACKRKDGRASRSALKNHKFPLLSPDKPKNTETTGEVIEPLIKANSTLPTNKMAKINGDSQVMGFAFGIQKGKGEERRNNDAAELRRGEEGGGNAAGFYPMNERGAGTGLGPYEWLDGEMKRLKYFFESSSDRVEASGNYNAFNRQKENGVMDIITEEKEIGMVMGLQKAATSEERESSSVWSASNAETEEWYASSSPVTSCFSEWVDWEVAGSVVCDDTQRQVLDVEGDNMVSWLWGSGNIIE